MLTLEAWRLNCRSTDGGCRSHHFNDEQDHGFIKVKSRIRIRIKVKLDLDPQPCRVIFITVNRTSRKVISRTLRKSLSES